MTSITVERTINAPIEVVFARASDVHNWAKQVESITDIEVYTEGPVGNGTRFKETRMMWGKEASEEMTFADFDPPSGYTLLASSHGCDYVTRHAFESVEGGTKMSLTFSGTPKTLSAKLMAPIFGFLKKSMCKMIEKDLDNLADACEQEAEPASA